MNDSAVRARDPVGHMEFLPMGREDRWFTQLLDYRNDMLREILNEPGDIVVIIFF